MKNLTSALWPVAVACAALASNASAQDRSAVDWTGPYVGIHAGGAFNAETRFDRTTGDLPNNTNALEQGLRPFAQTIDDSGFTGGVQAGYNYQFGMMAGGALVAGLEADIAYTDLDETVSLRNVTNIGPLGAPSATPVSRVNEYNGALKALGTVRGRLGLAYDRLLFYGTAGLAYGDVERETIYYGPNADTTPFFQGSEDGWKTGYVYGAGMEYAVSPDSMLSMFNSAGATLKVEYLHYDLGEDSLRFPGVNGGATIGGYTSRVRTDGDIVRVGVNFMF